MTVELTREDNAEVVLTAVANPSDVGLELDDVAPW